MVNPKNKRSKKKHAGNNKKKAQNKPAPGTMLNEPVRIPVQGGEGYKFTFADDAGEPSNITLWFNNLLISTKPFPIQDLPDRVLALTFRRFSLPHRITTFRLVCRRWCTVVEEDCSKLECLKILGSTVADLSSYQSQLVRNQLTHDQDFQLKLLDGDDLVLPIRELTRDFCDFLLRLFPNIRKLIFKMPYCWARPNEYGGQLMVPTGASFNLVNYLLLRWSKSLEQLSLFAANVSDIHPKSFNRNLVPMLVHDFPKLVNLDLMGVQLFGSLGERTSMSVVLPKLERLSIGGVDLPKLSILRHLGPQCKSLSLCVYQKWTPKNLAKAFPVSLRSVTHLTLPVERASAVEFICDHFPSLERLDLEFCGLESVQLDTYFLKHISKLAKLRELRLTEIAINLNLIKTFELKSFAFICPQLKALYLSEIENKFEDFVKPKFDPKAFWLMVERLFPGLTHFQMRTSIELWKSLGEGYKAVYYGKYITRRLVLVVTDKHPIGGYFEPWRPSLGRHEERVEKGDGMANFLAKDHSDSGDSSD